MSPRVLATLALPLAAADAGKFPWAPLAEPPAAEYFDLPKDGSLQPLERISNVDPADFEERIRRGIPFIVTDAGQTNSFRGKSCESFHKRFPKAQMRAEYRGGEGERFVKLGSKSWFSNDRLTEKQPEHQSGGARPLSAPYVWHVKDGGHEAPPAVRTAIQREWVPPYFVRGQTNLREANESMEFWFSRRNGAVLAHADTYCIPAVSLQLTGKKHWRLMPPPPMVSVYDRYESHDSGLYNTGLWRPTFEATVNEGEAIVFFPNQFHETFIPEENPECTVAATFQFQTPVPVRYLRAFLPTHVLSHLYYEQHCSELWHSFATLLPPKQSKPTEKDAEIKKQAAALMKAVDSDKNGTLTVEELRKHLDGARPAWPRWFLTDDYFYDYKASASEKKIMGEELLHNRAEDTLAYLDSDRDNLVSASELLAALRQWNVVHKKLRDTERLPGARGGYKKHRKKSSDVLKLEKWYLETFPGAGRSASNSSALSAREGGEL